MQKTRINRLIEEAGSKGQPHDCFLQPGVFLGRKRLVELLSVLKSPLLVVYSALMVLHFDNGLSQDIHVESVTVVLGLLHSLVDNSLPHAGQVEAQSAFPDLIGGLKGLFLKFHVPLCVRGGSIVQPGQFLVQVPQLANVYLVQVNHNFVSWVSLTLNSVNNVELLRDRKSVV